MGFKQHIQESAGSTAVFTYGRMNPPTQGHAKVIQKTIDHATKVRGTPHIFISHSHDSKKNPLAPEHKLAAVQAAYKDVTVAVSTKETAGPIQIAKHLHQQGHQHLVMVAGSDRVDEYHKLLHKYNNKEYSFKSIKVVSAGQRDPDAEGAEGISGTKMREYAAAGKKEEFKSNLMAGLSDSHRESIYNETRKGMKIDEESSVRFDWGTPEGTKYMKKLTPGETAEVAVKPKKSLREQYFANQIYRLGDLVTTNEGTTGHIVYRGTNYVTIRNAVNEMSKHWLDSIHESPDNDDTPTAEVKVSNKKSVDSFKDLTKKKEIEKTSVQVKAVKEPVNELTISAVVSMKDTNRSALTLPALLMSPEQREAAATERAQAQQISFGGYVTQNFDKCPAAVTRFNKLIADKFTPTTAVKSPVSSNWTTYRRQQFKHKVID